MGSEKRPDQSFCAGVESLIGIASNTLKHLFGPARRVNGREVLAAEAKNHSVYPRRRVTGFTTLRFEYIYNDLQVGQERKA